MGIVSREEIDSALWMDKDKTIEFRIYDIGDSAKYAKMRDPIQRALHESGFDSAILR